MFTINMLNYFNKKKNAYSHLSYREDSNLTQPQLQKANFYYIIYDILNKIRYQIIIKFTLNTTQNTLCYLDFTYSLHYKTTHYNFKYQQKISNIKIHLKYQPASDAGVARKLSFSIIYVCKSIVFLCFRSYQFIGLLVF